MLFVSFVAPHFPLTAPPEWYYEYAAWDLPMPKQYAAAERPETRAFDALMLAQFSMAPSREAVQSVVSCPVLTSPASAVRKLRELLR